MPGPTPAAAAVGGVAGAAAAADVDGAAEGGVKETDGWRVNLVGVMLPLSLSDTAMEGKTASMASNVITCTSLERRMSFY